MTYEMYHLIFVIGAVLAGVLFAAACIIFVVLKIPRVVGELSGSTARKAIQAKEHRQRTASPQRGIKTEKISTTALKVQAEQAVQTEQTELLRSSGATEKLDNGVAQLFEVEQEIMFIHTQEWTV